MSSDPEVILLITECASEDSLAHELLLDGYRLLCAPRLERGTHSSGSVAVDLIILTPTSQQAVRLHELRALRAGELDPEFNPGMRALWISAGEEVSEVLRGFDAGADDVLRSPFVHAELLARVRALMRRGVLGSAGVIQFGALRIDTKLTRPRSTPPRFTCAAWSTRSLFTSHATPPACTPSRSCSASCGATRPVPPHEPSTPTPAGCGARSRTPAPPAG